MADANDAYAQIAPDSTGAKVRTLKVISTLPDGTLQTVHMQVMSIFDEMGREVELPTATTQALILDELRKMRDVLEEIAGFSGRHDLKSRSEDQRGTGRIPHYKKD